MALDALDDRGEVVRCWSGVADDARKAISFGFNNQVEDYAPLEPNEEKR